MEVAFRVCLFIAGVINFVPVMLAFLPSKISESYGVDVSDVNYELLLRHRAILFGIIGGVMIYAAFSKKYCDLAFTIGFVSMISFFVLVKLMDGDVNTELRNVLNIDIAGIVILLIGLVLYKLK